ncbi:protein-disulfide reductase DsbD [Parasalinivibrio latis]
MISSGTRFLSLLMLVLSLGFIAPAQAAFNFGAQAEDPQFVPVDEAFPFNFSQQGNTVRLDWQVKPDYYLYEQRIKVETKNGAEIGPLEMRRGEPHNDEFFGEVNIYTTPLEITVPLIKASDTSELIVHYQGCAKAGFCYPPEIRTIPLMAVSAATNTPDSSQLSAPAEETKQPVIQNDGSADAQLAQSLADNWWQPLLFLALGIGLAFTPCVLPMYPILTGIVLGGGKLSQGKAFRLAFIYVQGMALTYTLLGLVVASAGLQFQAALQHPYVLVGLSIMFVALALSMFGLYSLQLPSGVQTWLNNLSNQQKGGSTAGVFTMGAISGLICSPCTTAPLSGALLYVAQTGDLLFGGITLYALAIGMGIPLILAAMFGNKLLPKAGNWMNYVKVFFGFVLLAVPLFLLERIIPEHLANYGWALLGLAFAAWLYHTKTKMPAEWQSSLVGIVAILGISASGISLYQNYTGLPQASEAKSEHVVFTKVETVSELNKQLETAKAAGKPVMLDFYADWCVSCKEFDKYTFNNPDVKPLLENIVLLQADVTKSEPDDIALLQQLDVLGLPTIDFWDAKGNPLPQARLTGFMKAEPFIKHLKSHYIVQ